MKTAISIDRKLQIADRTFQDGPRRSPFALSTGSSYPPPLDPRSNSVPAPAGAQTGTKQRFTARFAATSL
ncbi:MAG: hypothetical protein MUC60_04010 [Oscillatoria sp. Prado101]|nr:hypothetical protein [Oscillatoria sp. Prado101]